MRAALALLLLASIVSVHASNHTLVKLISGWDDDVQPTRDYNTGWCHVSKLANTS